MVLAGPIDYGKAIIIIKGGDKELAGVLIGGILEAEGVILDHIVGTGRQQGRAHDLVDPDGLLVLARVVGLRMGHSGKENVGAVPEPIARYPVPDAQRLDF